MGEVGAWAGQYIPSGLSAIYNATTPLMTLVISLAVIPNERLTPFRTFGVLLGAVGILTIMTIAAACLVPVVLAYQAWTYWVFRHRLTEKDLGHY